MNIKDAIKSQYSASLAMLRQTIECCPDSLWQSTAYQNRTWHIAYHVLFYTHFYLYPTENDFVPWEKHQGDYTSLGSMPPVDDPVYTKSDILAYLALCLEQVETGVNALDLEAESGFHWLPFNKLELQFYNIRHVQQHTGELCERLGVKGEVEVDWVGQAP